MQTTPKGIKYPDTGDDLSMEAILSEMAYSIDEALYNEGFYAMDGGLATNVPTGTGNFVTVQFAPGRFSKPPIVVGLSLGTGTTSVYVYDITTTSFKLRSASGSNTQVNWLAIQMTSAGSEG